MPSMRSRLYALLALLALLPVGAFALDRGDVVIGFSVVCVFLVAGSLALLFRDDVPALS